MKKKNVEKKEIRDVSLIKRLDSIVPLNDEQREYTYYLRNSMITLAEGRAGSGKTLLALVEGLKLIAEKKIDKICYIRCYIPSIATEREMGALKGEADEKLAPFRLPIYDNLMHVMPKKGIDDLFEKGIIEVSNVSFLRGRSFDDTMIIADEFQEACKDLTHLVVSRLGHNSKLAILCSESQVKSTAKTKPFIHNLIGIAQNFDEIGLVRLTECVRNSHIDKILRAIEEA